MPAVSDEEIKGLMYDGFERAFLAQMGKLFEVYLSNVSGGSTEQAGRTKKGIENAIEAYRLAVSAVDSWESETGG